MDPENGERSTINVLTYFISSRCSFHDRAKRKIPQQLELCYILARKCFLEFKLLSDAGRVFSGSPNIERRQRCCRTKFKDDLASLMGRTLLLAYLGSKIKR